MKYRSVKAIDIVLCIIAIAVLVFISISRLEKPVLLPQHIYISLSPQWEAVFGIDIVNGLIQEFEEQNPDLKIQVLAPEPSDIDGDADIVLFDDCEFISLMRHSALHSLPPIADDDEQAITHWALPLMSFMDLFLYNIDILQAANSDRPPRTRAEFIAAARAIAGRNPASTGSIFPFALGLSPADPLALRRDIYPWIWTDGGDLDAIDAAGAPLPRVINNTISFFGQLHRERLLAPGTLEKNGRVRLEEFAEGKIAMMTASARDIAYLRRNAPNLNFGITAIPATSQGKNRIALSGIYAGISAACVQPDEAWMFLSFIADKSHILAQALNAVPGNFSNAFRGEYIVYDTLYSKAWEIFEAADIVDYYAVQPQNEAIDRIIREKLMEVIF